MNQENMIWGLLTGQIAKEDLGVKGIEVDQQFDVRQMLISAIIDNPWLIFLLLQFEVRRLDNKAINPAAQAKIIEVWLKIKDDLCKIESVTLDDNTLSIQLPAQHPWSVKDKPELINVLNHYFAAFSGIPASLFEKDCPLPDKKED